MQTQVEKSLHLALEKKVINQFQKDQIQKELAELQASEINLPWMDLAMGKKWTTRDQLIVGLGEQEVPSESPLASLSAEEDRDLALFLSKYNFIKNEEFSQATEGQQRLLQRGVYKKICEVVTLKGWLDEKTVLTLGEVHQALSQETYGDKKKVQTSFGLNRPDLQFAKLVLQNHLADRTQVLQGLHIQRSLYQWGLEQRLGEILYAEGILDKAQIEGLLSLQTKTFKEKGFALSALIQWDEAKDKKVILTLQKYEFLSQEQVKEAVAIKNKLKVLNIQRPVGEILLLRGDITKNQIQKVLRGQVKTLLKSEAGLSKQEKSQATKVVIAVAVALLMMALGVVLEKVTHKNIDDDPLDNFGLSYSQTQTTKGSFDRIFTPEDEFLSIQKFARNHPERREVIIQKYNRFIRRHRGRRGGSRNGGGGPGSGGRNSSGGGNNGGGGRTGNGGNSGGGGNNGGSDGGKGDSRTSAELIARASSEVKRLRSKAAIEYEKLVQQVRKIIKDGGKYGIPLAEDHIDLFIKKYRGTIWEDRAQALKKSLYQKPAEKNPTAVAKGDGSGSDSTTTSTHKFTPKENKEEREKMQEYLASATKMARSYFYDKAVKVLDEGLAQPWKNPKNKKFLQLAKEDMATEVQMFRRIRQILEAKKDKISFYWKGSLRNAEKVTLDGIQITATKKIPWPDVPLALLAKIPKWKQWTKKDYYPLGIFLATHHLDTLGYRYLRKLVARRSPLQAHIEAYSARLEDRFVSATGFNFYRDQLVRGMDYPELSRNRVFYLEQWFDKRPLLKKFGQSLTKKLQSDQMAEARKELIEFRKGLYKEKGVLAVDTLVDQGDPSKRVDILLMCDGFTKEQMPKFHQLSQKIITQLKSIEPFKSYWEHINIHRIDLYEEKPGIAGSDEKSAITRLGCHVTALNQLKSDRKKVAFYSALAPDADLTIIVANIKKVRATGGGGVLCIDIDGKFDKRVVMGLGFAFGNLTVEYVDEKMVSQYPPFGPKKEYLYFNVTRESNPKLAKWHYWNYPPHKKAKVGCFEGAYFREKTFFRPTEKCRMQSAEVDHYCVVCLEQIERSFYRYVSPIDEFLPILPVHRMFKDDRMEFKVKMLSIKNKGQVKGKFSYQWLIDSKPVTYFNKKGNWLILGVRGKSLKPGTHYISTIMRYSNRRVRRDLGVLEDQRTWEVEVLPFVRPKMIYPKKLESRAGKVVEFRFGVQKPFHLKDFKWKALDMPPRAIFDPSQAYFQWCPGAFQRGAYTIHFEAEMKKRPDIKLTFAVEVQVWAPGDNNIPFFRYQKPLVVREGKIMDQKIQAFDVDGDHLRFSIQSKDLPPGMKLDPNKGVIHWRPTLFQGGTYSFKIRITDGRKGRTLPLIIKVENHKPGPKEKYLRDFGIFLGLRSDKPKVLANAIKQLEGFAPITRWMKWSTFLRDFHPKLHNRAFAVFQRALAKKNIPAHKLFLFLVEPYVMQLMDDPKTLRAIRAAVRFAKKKIRPYPTYCRSIEKQLKKIDKYNKYRFKEDLKK